MKRYLLVILALVVIGIGMYSFTQSQSKNTSNTNKLQVITSFYPLSFLSSYIGGEKAEVKNITPAGAEPHDYEPTSQDIAGIEESDILVLNGGVEPWSEKIRENLKGKNVSLVVAGEGLLNQQVEEEGEVVQDPHIWLAPQLAKKEVARITQAFITKDIANKVYYQSNEKSLNEKLDQLDTKYKEGLSNCESKDIITSHAAFGYLAKAYGLNQVAITGLSPDAEPSSQQLAEVAKFATEHNVKYIFFESLVSPKLSETIAQEVGAKTLVLDPLEGIPDDEIKQGKNYFTVMEDNLENLQIALACTK